MATASIRDQIVSQLERLTTQQQQEILHHALSSQGELPPGIPGDDLIALAHDINFPAQALAEINQAIEEDCECSAVI